MPRLNSVYPSTDFPQKLDIGDYAVLVGQGGAAPGKSGKSGLVQINAVEPIQLLDQHGVVVVWLDSGSSPAGYGAIDGNGPVGHIPFGGSVVTNGGLVKLQFRPRQLAQLRFRLKWVVAPTGSVHDYDVQILNPVSSQRGAFAHVNAVLNMMMQGHDPADVIAPPAQGANETLPAAFPAMSPWALAARTEQYLLEDLSMGVKVNNNGAGATVAGGLGLEVSGFLYNFESIDPASGPTYHYMRNVDLVLPMGLDPKDIVPIQIGRIDPQ